MIKTLSYRLLGKGKKLTQDQESGVESFCARLLKHDELIIVSFPWSCSGLFSLLPHTSWFVTHLWVCSYLPKLANVRKYAIYMTGVNTSLCDTSAARRQQLQAAGVLFAGGTLLKHISCYKQEVCWETGYEETTLMLKGGSPTTTEKKWGGDRERKYEHGNKSLLTQRLRCDLHAGTPKRVGAMQRG